MRRRINADQAQYNCHFAHHNHPAAADDDDDDDDDSGADDGGGGGGGDGGGGGGGGDGVDVIQVMTTQMPCSLSGQVDYNYVEDKG